MRILVLNHDQITQLLPISRCIDVMAGALESLARGLVHMPLRMAILPPDANGMMALMPAYQSGGRAAYGLKAICMFPNNVALGKDAHQGAVLLFSAVTGELRAVVNASAVTAIRTAAVSGLATKLLARKNACDLAIIGAGVQAREHLKAMATVRPLQRVRVADLVPERARHLAAEMAAYFPFAIEAAANAETAVRNADIIVTVTNSSKPVLQREWISDGAHINLVGACTPKAREADSATMAAAKLYVDRRESTLNESGDYLLAAEEGAVGPKHIRGEIGELLTGNAVGRTSDREITVFKSLGVAVEDLAAAEYLYGEAEQKHLGTWIDF